MLTRHNRIRNQTLLLTVALVVFPLDQVHAQSSELARAAAAMEPGQWMEFRTENWNEALLAQCNLHILQYTDDAKWDPLGGAIYFLGSAHSCHTSRLIRYKESTNAWQAAPDSFSIGHAYDHSAFKPGAGRFYHRESNSFNVHEYDVATKLWVDTIPDIDVHGGKTMTGALEYFPELNGLVFVDGAWGVALFDFKTRQWRALAKASKGSHGLPVVDGMNRLSILAEYSPVASVMVFGGGHQSGSNSNVLYRLAADGAITRLKIPPLSEIAIYSTILTVDPNSGRFLVVGEKEGRSFHEFDALTDTWLELDADAIPNDLWSKWGVDWTVAVPITNHGVVAFLSWAQRFDPPQIFLYRHSPGSGTPPSGRVPIDLPADPTR